MVEWVRPRNQEKRVARKMRARRTTPQDVENSVVTMMSLKTVVASRRDKTGSRGARVNLFSLVLSHSHAHSKTVAAGRQIFVAGMD